MNVDGTKEQLKATLTDRQRSMKIVLASGIILTLMTVSVVVSPIAQASSGPVVKDPKLEIERIANVTFPIDMSFLEKNDFLVATRHNGEIVRIVDGLVLPEPLLDLDVANAGERGLISMVVAKNGSKVYVYTYHTQSGGGEDGDDISKGIRPLGSFVYRFELVNDSLTNPLLLAFLNTTSNIPGEDAHKEAHHVGGKILLGPDGNLYILVGDGLDHRTQAQNNITGEAPDGTGGILRMTQSGKPVTDPPLGNVFPLNLYYAYGIRNGIAMDFDPISGHLWDAEAGPRYGDEINLVVPGFNSGWRPVMGFIGENFERNKLVDFNGRGKYEDPRLVWNYTVTPTSMKFLNTTKLGPQYENDLFLGRYFLADVSQAVLYHFNLNDQRDSLIVKDNVVDSPQEDEENIVVSGLGAITDIEVGPDGYLYLVQLTKPGGIYRIFPASNATSN